MESYKKNTHFILTAFVIIMSQTCITSSVIAAKYDLTTENIFEPSKAFPTYDLSPQAFVINNLSENEIKQRKYFSVIALTKKGQFEQATNKINSLLVRTPNDAHLYNLQALLNYATGDKAAAKESYQKAINLDPENSLAYYGLAKLAITDKQIDIAKDYADKLLSINEKSARPYLLLAEIADKNEIEHILLNGYKKAQGNIIAEMRIVSVLGAHYVNQNQPEKFLSLSKEMVNRYPDNNDILSILATAQDFNKQPLEAEQTLHKIITQDKHDKKHRILLVSLLSKHVNEEKEVLNLLDEIYQIDPKNPQPLVLKAHYLLKFKHYKTALDTANKIDQLFPTLAIGIQLKGDIYSVEQQLDKALEAYKQAYQINSNNKILMAMANILQSQNKQTEAIMLLKQELRKNDNNTTINFKLALIYQQQADYKQAEKHYNAMLTEQPDNALALNNLAWIYAQQNNPKSIKLAEQAYKNAPQSAAAADTYGYILIKQGELEKGLTILQKAAKAVPQANDIQYHLAEAYSLQGNKQKAISLLEPLTQREVSFPEKENAKQLLIKLRAQ